MGRFIGKRQACETVIIKYFIFWLSIYLFIFNFFFGKNVLERASLLLEPSLQGRGGTRHLAPPPPQKSSVTTGGSIGVGVRKPVAGSEPAVTVPVPRGKSMPGNAAARRPRLPALPLNSDSNSTCTCGCQASVSDVLSGFCNVISRRGWGDAL